MINKLFNIALPILILLGLVWLSASIGGSGCVPPATCAGTGLGPLASFKALLVNPLHAFSGVVLILSMLTMSILGGVFLTVALYGGLIWWLISGVRRARR